MRADALSYKLKYGSTVIIKSANDVTVDLILNSANVESSLKSFKMILTFITKMVNSFGRILCYTGAYRTLTVKNTKRICKQTALTGITQVVLTGREVLNQRSLVLRSAARASD